MLDFLEDLFDLIPIGFIVLLSLLVMCLLVLKVLIKFAAVIIPVLLVVGVCACNWDKIKKFYIIIKRSIK